jgi:hypothetical protein
MNVNHSSINKGRRIAANLVIGLGGLMLIGSACAKLAHVPKVANQLAAFGFDGNKLTMIAILELACALLYLLPFTRSAGVLMVSAYMGGAVATHVQHDHSFLQPAIVLAILWFGAWLRHPEVLWSLNQMQPKSNLGNVGHDVRILGRTGTRS